jgi:hypothetical protein
MMKHMTYTVKVIDSVSQVAHRGESGVGAVHK